jgi:hypothetical protein
MDDALKSENEKLRDALNVAASWLERWAVHVGRCRGDHLCECGLTNARYEASLALNHPPSSAE